MKMVRRTRLHPTSLIRDISSRNRNKSNQFSRIVTIRYRLEGKVGLDQDIKFGSEVRETGIEDKGGETDTTKEEIETGLEDKDKEEMTDTCPHSYAVIPPLLLSPDERRRKITNNNGLIQDPMLMYKEREYISMWTDEEKIIFRKKYLQQPKNFALIATYLERKTVSDCVQYYYLSKKTENFKQLLRNSRAMRNQPPRWEVIAPGMQGMMTRKKVEEIFGKETPEGTSKANISSNTRAQATSKE